MQDGNTDQRVMLVYQGGLANVFRVDCFNLSDYGREAKRVLQADFHTCAAFARGMGAMGAIVRTAACNAAGDITHAHWTDNLRDQPFFSQMIRVHAN